MLLWKVMKHGKSPKGVMVARTGEELLNLQSLVYQGTISVRCLRIIGRIENV